MIAVNIKSAFNIVTYLMILITYKCCEKKKNIQE